MGRPGTLAFSSLRSGRDPGPTLISATPGVRAVSLPLPSLAFQASGDVVSAVLGYLPVIVLIVVLVGLMMWFLAWMARYFEYLKTVESAWLDRTTLDFVRRVLEGIWIVIMVILVLAIAQTQSRTIRDVLVEFVARLPAAFFFVFVLFAAAIAVRILHRFAAYLRGELKTKPRRIAPPSALAFTELVLKYVIYIVALVIAVLGSIAALPPPDRNAIYAVVALPALEPGAALEIGLGVLIVAVADRFVASIFEDLKHRTRKFSIRALDEFKAIARYAVWLLGALVILLIFLAIILPAADLIVFAVGFVAFLVVVSLLASEPLRDALGGVVLMRGDPFDVGDRIKVGENLVADVVSMSLTLTCVRTLRGELVQFPNRRLLQMPVVNFTRSKPYAIRVEIAVGFDVDHDRVRNLLIRAARETDGAVRDRAPEVYGKGLEGDAIVYQLYVYTDQPERMKEVQSTIIWKIQDLFHEAGIRPKGGPEAG